MGRGWPVAFFGGGGDGVGSVEAARAQAAMVRQAALDSARYATILGHRRAGGSWGEVPEPEVIEIHREIGGLRGVGEQAGHAGGVS